MSTRGRSDERDGPWSEACQGLLEFEPGTGKSLRVPEIRESTPLSVRGGSGHYMEAL
jgi:hypothetical protein